MSDITIINRKHCQYEEKGIDIRLKEEHLLDQSNKARDYFSNLQNELDQLDADLKSGLSYLDMKNDTLLSYMIDLCNIVLRKVRGETISGHTSVERCVTYRVILEKIKAIDQRLAYQINKVISLPEDAEEGKGGINVEDLDIELAPDYDHGNSDEEDDSSSDINADGSRHQRRGSSVDDDEDDEVEGSSDGSDAEGEEVDKELKERLVRKQVLAEKSEAKKKHRSSSSAAVYKPPKLRSVAYDGDGGSETRSRHRKDYNDFYQDDENLDIVDESRTFRDEERTRYEEENYTRLPNDNPRKAKRKLRQKAMGGKGKKKFKTKRGKW